MGARGRRSTRSLAQRSRAEPLLLLLKLDELLGHAIGEVQPATLERKRHKERKRAPQEAAIERDGLLERLNGLVVPTEASIEARKGDAHIRRGGVDLQRSTARLDGSGDACVCAM